MKKLFTMIAVCAATFATYTASAGSPIQASKNPNPKSVSIPSGAISNSDLRSSCVNLANVLSTDTPFISTWQAPAVGYVAGNGALSNGTTLFPITGVAEHFTTSVAGPHVTTVLVDYAVAVINPGDSALTVTAYVYDTTGTSPFGGFAPGHALDSASVTLGSIADSISVGSLTVFNFTHQPTLSSHFFIGVSLPQVTGDTLDVSVTDHPSANADGNGWLDFGGAANGWGPYDSIFQNPATNSAAQFIIATVCGTTCPTITVTATEIGNSTSADASASGGVTPYSYAWSGGTASSTTDSVSGLTNGHSYTVTATDHNGCSGTATVSISTGIESIEAGVTNFSVFPNPSNGVFTANVSLVAASDVTISVTDMTGSKIFESTDKAVKDLSKQINLSTIATGIYFVSVKTAQGTANQRIVIK